MASLLRSIAEIWQGNEALCDLVPFSRVYTGRVPSTELQAMPYVSVIAGQGVQIGRSDKSRISEGPVSFSIWVADEQLEFGLEIAQAIADAYADNCWPLSETAKVFDCLDGGEPMTHQTDLPDVKAWEIIKLFHLKIERARVDREGQCCDGYAATSEDGQMGDSSTSE
jgi:hypothetical protein